MFLSVIVHTVLPGGRCNDPLPALEPPSHRARTLWLRGEVLSSRVNMFPFRVAEAVPFCEVPQPQKRYSPVKEFHRIVTARFESSCNRTSNTVTAKVQVFMLPEVSVALHVTAVVPVGKQKGDVMVVTAPLMLVVQLKVTPGQLSVAVTAKLAVAQGPPGVGVTAVILGGQIMVGA
jgi:hypothetical protein